ncbi:MAG: hypothetical protein AAGG51_17640 [Cyanobacteria bacterium P01_G01_bin.54]
MKTSLLRFTIALTSTAIALSLYLATLNHPTDLQKQLSTTTNTIALSGTAALFGLLNADESDQNPDR